LSAGLHSPGQRPAEVECRDGIFEGKRQLPIDFG
jgi:hypothetical protein